MHKFKEQICSSWFAPVGSASDYPLLSKWAIYEEVSIASPSVFLLMFFLVYSYFFYVCSSQLLMDPGIPMTFHLSTLYGLHSLVFTQPIMSWSGQPGMSTILTYPPDNSLMYYGNLEDKYMDSFILKKQQLILERELTSPFVHITELYIIC